MKDYTKSELSSEGPQQELAEQWRTTPRVSWGVKDYTKSELRSEGLHQEWAEQWSVSEDFNFLQHMLCAAAFIDCARV